MLINRLGGSGGGANVDLAITSLPNKTTYNKNAVLDLTGMVVQATYPNGSTEIVTDYTTTPASGAVLSTTGILVVAVNYEGAKCFFSIEVMDFSLVTWAGGTDIQIVTMVQAADNGEINLSDYWTVGDERTVHLSAMEAIGVSESHVAQDVTMVLMNEGGKTLADGISECNFIVGLKNGLANGTTREGGYMNSGRSNYGGWENCARRAWCNSIFKNAIPSSLLPIFKQHKNITAGWSYNVPLESVDYFALPAEKEVFGTNTEANSTAEANLTQFTYYQTTVNRRKKAGDTGSYVNWWERSPYSGLDDRFCYLNESASSEATFADANLALAPFGVI